MKWNDKTAKKKDRNTERGMKNELDVQICESQYLDGESSKNKIMLKIPLVLTFK